MTRLLKVSTLTVVFLAVGVGSAQAQHQTAKSTDPAAKAIESVWTAYIAAAKKGDVTGAVALYTTDATILAPAAATVRGRAAVTSHIKSMFAAAKFVDMTYKTESFERDGDIAIETGTQVMTVQEKGKQPANAEMRYFLVYKNENGHWLAHFDATLPMPPAPPAK